MIQLGIQHVLVDVKGAKAAADKVLVKMVVLEKGV